MDFIKNKYREILFIIACVYTFVFSLMFQALDIRKTMLISLAFIVIAAIINRNIFNDWALRFITVAALVIGIIDFHAGLMEPLYYSVVWIGAYIIGKQVIGLLDDNGKTSFWASASLTLGLYIQGLLNYSNHNEGFEGGISWDGWNEFWTGTFSSRTVYVFDFLFITAWLAYAIINYNNSRILLIVSLLLSCLAFVCDFVMAKGRLFVVMQFAVLLIIGLVFMIKKWKDFHINSRKRITVLAIVIMFFLVVIWALISINAFGLGVIYHNSFLARDGGILGNVRFRSMVEGVHEMILHPEGGWVTPSLGIAHNTFLLFAAEYDIFVFMLMMGFEVVILISCIQLLRRKCMPIDYLLVGLVLVVNLYFMIETCPWRYRNYWFFILFTSGMLRRKKELQNEVK